MRKLVNGRYVNVDDIADKSIEDVREDFAGVIDADDVEEMNKGQLVDFLRKQSVPATRSWKEETLRAKAHAMLRGEG